MSTAAANTVRQGLPSRSAHWVASLRAVHQLLDEPLILADPLALALLDERTGAAVREDPFALNDPMTRGLRAAVVARSRFAEDELSQGVGAGVRQYVLLGAGLDTFAYRNPYPAAKLRVFELDHQGTHSWKRHLLAQAGIGAPASLTFLPVDFENDDLREALLEAGFQADQPACVSWMGVTPYLTAGAVLRTLKALGGLAVGSSLCFDYRVPPTQLGPVDRVIDEAIGQRAGAAGEPWLSTFDAKQLQRQLLGLGFSSATNVTPDDLNARYFARRKDGLRVGGSFRILRAGKG